jgi:hypothetical protein
MAAIAIPGMLTGIKNTPLRINQLNFSDIENYYKFFEINNTIIIINPRLITQTIKFRPNIVEVFLSDSKRCDLIFIIEIRVTINAKTGPIT